jgi:hypothetical protein
MTSTIRWGILAASFYLAAALLTAHFLPVRLLYDGEEIPLPYRWVVRPPNATNAASEPPLPGAGQIVLPPAGPGGGSVSTGDGQAVIIFVRGTIAPRSGETSVTIRLTPLDARALGRLPAGIEFDGNAYRIEGEYTASKQPIVFRDTATLILRHATTGTLMLRLSQGRWEPIEDSIHLPSFQVVASTDRLGVFTTGLLPSQRSHGLPPPWLAALTATGAAALVAVRPGRRSSR